ncbi:MAG: hypothetical protein AB7L71_11025 [Vicinamibacterales bacterium]
MLDNPRRGRLAGRTARGVPGLTGRCDPGCPGLLGGACPRKGCPDPTS